MSGSGYEAYRMLVLATGAAASTPLLAELLSPGSWLVPLGAYAWGAAGAASSLIALAFFYPRRRDEWVPLGLVVLSLLYSAAVAAAGFAGFSATPSCPVVGRSCGLCVVEEMLRVILWLVYVTYGVSGAVAAVSGYIVYNTWSRADTVFLRLLWYAFALAVLGAPFISGLLMVLASRLPGGHSPRGGGGVGALLLLPAYAAMMYPPLYAGAVVSAALSLVFPGVYPYALLFAALIIAGYVFYGAAIAVYDRCVLAERCTEVSADDYAAVVYTAGSVIYPGLPVAAALLPGLAAMVALSSSSSFLEQLIAVFVLAGLMAVLGLGYHNAVVIHGLRGLMRRRGFYGPFESRIAFMEGVLAAVKPSLLLAASAALAYTLTHMGWLYGAALTMEVAAATAYYIDIGSTYRIVEEGVKEPGEPPPPPTQLAVSRPL